MESPSSRHHHRYKPAPHEFSDEESTELLRALYCYIEYYDITIDSIADLVVELTQSQDRTSDIEDQIRSELEARFADSSR